MSRTPLKSGFSLTEVLMAAGILMIGVENHYPLRDANLRCSETNAGCGIHGFEHIVNQLDGFFAKIFHW